MSWLISPNMLVLAALIAGGAFVYAANQQRVAYDRGAAAGKAEVITKSIQAGKKANAEARKAHRSARKPGAAERLRKSACRDCGRP